jgi:heat shock protein HspQ
VVQTNPSPQKQSFFQKRLPIFKGISLALFLAILVSLGFILTVIFGWWELYNLFYGWAYTLVPVEFLAKVLALLLLAIFAAIPFSEVIKAFFNPFGSKENKAKRRKLRVITFASLAVLLLGYHTIGYAVNFMSALVKEVTTERPKKLGVTEYAPKYNLLVSNSSGRTYFMFVSPDNLVNNMTVAYVLKPKTDTLISLSEGTHFFSLINTNGENVCFSSDNFDQDKDNLSRYYKKQWREFNGKEYRLECYFEISVSGEDWQLQIGSTVSYSQKTEKQHKQKGGKEK